MVQQGFELTYNVFHVEALTPFFDGAGPLPLSGDYQHCPHSFMQHLSHKGRTSPNSAGFAPPAAHIMLPCLLFCFSMTLWAVQIPEESNRGLPTGVLETNPEVAITTVASQEPANLASHLLGTNAWCAVSKLLPGSLRGWQMRAHCGFMSAAIPAAKHRARPATYCCLRTAM